MKEFDLYPPMMQWLKSYLEDRYPSAQIFVVDAHAERLDRVLKKYGIVHQQAIGVDIQIDVLGIVKTSLDFKLFFIEAKCKNLTLHDLGQLWAYCKLIDPEGAFLLSSAGLGSLNKMYISAKTFLILAMARESKRCGLGFGIHKKMLRKS